LEDPSELLEDPENAPLFDEETEEAAKAAEHLGEDLSATAVADAKLIEEVTMGPKQRDSLTVIQSLLAQTFGDLGGPTEEDLHKITAQVGPSILTLNC